MEYETYADVIDAYNADNMGYSTLTDYIKGQNIKIKEIEMDPIGDMQKIFENKADGGSIGIEVLFKEKMKNGGRIGFDNGGQTAPAGTFTLTDYVNFLNVAEDFNRLYDKGEEVVGEVGEFVEQMGDKEYDDYTGKELIRERELEGKLENLEDEFDKTEDDYFDYSQRELPADEEAMGAYARQLINDLNQRDVTLGTLAEIAGLKKGGRVGFNMGGAQFTSGGNISPGTDVRGNVRDDNPFTGGGGDGPKGPPVIINPTPTKDKSTELLTFDEYTGKPMTYADVASANKFLNFVKTKGGYTMGEDTEADALYDAYRTATGRDTFMQDATVDSVTNMRTTDIDGDTKSFFDQTSTITDNPTGRMSKSLTLQTPTSFTQRFTTPTGIMENDVPQKFGAPQSLSVDPYSNNIIGSDLRADLTKSQKKALGKQKMGYDMGIFSIDDVRENIKPLGDPDNPATNEEIKEFFQAKDGGRVGLFMGGPPLEGQALAIYNSMNVTGATDQEIADRLQSLGYYTPGGSTPDTPSDNIIGSQINQGAGGGGGITELQKTYTRETPRPYTVRNFPETSVQKDFFETKQLPSYTYNEMGGLKITPDVRKDMTEYFADETSVGNYPVPEKDTSFIGSALDKFRSIKDKFFQPKVKGTLGTRLANQPRIPLPGAIASYALSPFNPESRNFNPLLEGQLNFLEGLEGMIGRDPNTGGLKYGSGSVLAGKNVISGFGSNNYEVALNKYLQRMNRYEKPTEFQKKRIEQAQAELAAEKQRQIREAKTKAEALAAIKSQGKMDYNPNIHGPIDYGRDSQGNQSFDSGQGFGIGSDGGPVSNRTGRGRTGYSDGGLATMFKRKR